MIFLFMICVAFSISGISTNDIKSKINSYFGSDIIRTFEKQWKKHEISLEYALNLALQQGYGQKAMNVYINRLQDPLTLTIGYYHTDNQVHMVIQDLNLEELPHIIDADIDFSLSSNVLSFDASVSRMIVHGSYVLFRNKSDLIFSVADQNPYESSPFRFQQVRNIGEVAITIEGCTLSGVVIATLTGNSVHLGYNQIKLTDCQYNLEIHSPGTGAPPVMVPYLPKGDKHLNIEHLLMRPIAEELIPKLQAEMFSYVNVSAILTDKHRNIQEKQKTIFDDTKTYINQLVRKMNERSIESNMGTINMGDFSITWDDAFEAVPKATTASLSNMILMGLDTLYSSNTGGPFRLTETEIVEQLRFSALQVVGKISIKGFKDDNEFAVEIFDFAVDVTLDLNLKATFNPVGWRFLEFSCPKMEFPPVESFVIGYLLNELPKRITSHLNSVFNGGGSQKLDLPLEDGVKETESDGKFLSDVVEPNNDDNNIEIDVEIGASKEGHGDDHETLSDDKVMQLHGEAASNLQQEAHLVKLLDESIKSDPKVKLHSVQAEPHFIDKGPVKLHHVEVEPYKESDDPIKAHDDNTVKLHGEEATANAQEGQLLKLLGESIKNEPKAKLKVESEPHFVDKGPIKLHHVAVEPYREDDDRHQLNDDASGNHIVKQSNIEATPHDQEAKIVQLLGESIKSKPIVKLHHVEAEPHFVDRGPAKLHHVAIEPYKEGTGSDDGSVGSIKQLNHEEPSPYKQETQLLQLLDQGIISNPVVKLHHVQSEPHFVDKGPVKLHHVAVDPHQEDIGLDDGGIGNKKQLHYQEPTVDKQETQLLKLLDKGTKKKSIAKLHHIDEEPHFVEKGPIKVQHVEVEPYVENVRSSYPNGAIRSKPLGNRNKSQKIALRKPVQTLKQKQPTKHVAARTHLKQLKINKLVTATTHRPK